MHRRATIFCFDVDVPSILSIKNFLRATVSGQILILNTCVFVVTCIRGGVLFSPPDIAVLIEMGAKHSVLIGEGEVWRFVTPVFLHIGLLHFVFNSLGLVVIGAQIEKVFGKVYFALIYLGAGIAGNIMSELFSYGVVSAGASGALFGLLGTGYYLERLVSKRIRETTGVKMKMGTFGSLVVFNVILGILVPFIDNAAHIGGLVFGLLATMAILRLRPNALRPLAPLRGVMILAVMLLVLAATAVSVVERNRIINEVQERIDDGERELQRDREFEPVESESHV